MLYKSCQVCGKLFTSKDNGNCFSKQQMIEKICCSPVCRNFLAKVNSKRHLFNCEENICSLLIDDKEIIFDRDFLSVVKDYKFNIGNFDYARGYKIGFPENK